MAGTNNMVLSGELKNSEISNESDSTLGDFDVKFKIKTEEEYLNFQLEDLHHSIDIKEEIFPLEYQPNGELEAQFTCDICKACFTTKSSLEEHSDTHADDSSFSCEICDFKCQRKEELELHVKIHVSEKPFSCNFCDMKFAIKFLLSIHLKTHSGDKPFECQLCDFKCAEKDNFRSHLTTHATGQNFVCEICNLKFIKKSKLAFHLRSHIKDELFFCRRCNFQCAEKETIKEHVEAHGSWKKNFSCQVCHAKFLHSYHFAAHLRTHNGKQTYYCDICGLSFSRKRALISHIRGHITHTDAADKTVNTVFPETEVLQPNSNDDSLSQDNTSDNEYIPSDYYESDQITDEEPCITSEIGPKRTKTFDGKEVPNISGVIKNKAGKRIRNKIHACYFCQKTVINFAKHLEIKHSAETKVSKLLALPKHSEIRKDGFASLLRAGDFYHNIEVLSTGNGELILVRRPTEQEAKFCDYNDYGPCPRCLGFMLKRHLWHHVKTCCKAKRNNFSDSLITRITRSIIAESNAILNASVGTEFSNDFVFHIISKLRDDEVGKYCRTDNLILKFGAMQFEKYVSSQYELTRQSMRQLSRLTLRLRNIDDCQSKGLSEYLLPEKFDMIVEATKLLCMSHKSISKGPEFETSCLALKICYYLKKCASIKRGRCLKSRDLEGNETLLRFLSLMDLEWSTRVSSSADNTETEVLLPNSNDDFLSEDKASDQSDQAMDEESCISSSSKNTTATESSTCRSTEIAESSATSVIDLDRTKTFNCMEVPDISGVMKNEAGKRIRNKIHACYFCQKTVINFARHLEIKHRAESNVSKLLALPKHSESRRDGYASLLRAGDFYHNVEVLSTGNGELILVRRPTEQEAIFCNYTDYGPCPHCLGFMLKKHLWHHVKYSCTWKRSNLSNFEDSKSSRLVVAESNAILNDAFGAEFSKDFVVHIISKLRYDEVGKYCRNDSLILKFGAMQFEKYGSTQYESTRQSMRQLSRLTLKLRNIDDCQTKGLSEYLLPEKFDIIIEATKLLCMSHESVNQGLEFEIPSLALKIGHDLKKCASMKRGSCLKSGNLNGNEMLLKFLSLMDLEWPKKIYSIALTTLNNRKGNDSAIDKEEDFRGFSNAEVFKQLQNENVDVPLHVNAELVTVGKRKRQSSPNRSNKRSVIKRPWTSQEKAAVVSFFKTNIKNRQVPGKKSCTECIAKNVQVLSNRSWTDIKFCVKNHIHVQLKRSKNVNVPLHDVNAEPMASVVKRKRQSSTNRSTKRSVIKRPWTSQEKAVVLSFFKTSIKNKRVPGKTLCTECIEKNGQVLSNRSWTDIKFCVKNQIVKVSNIQE